MAKGKTLTAAAALHSAEVDNNIHSYNSTNPAPVVVPNNGSSPSIETPDESIRFSQSHPEIGSMDLEEKALTGPVPESAPAQLESVTDGWGRSILFHVISGDQVGEEFLVAADCTVGVMMDFIKRRVAEDKQIPEEARLELFDENGISLGLHKSEPLSRGTEFVRHRGVYFPMYFLQDKVGDSDSEDLAGKSERSFKYLDSKFEGEWDGESPCEEYDDAADETLQESQVDAGKKAGCGSWSESIMSISLAAFQDHSTQSAVYDEEYGEDGPHYHNHLVPQMIHSKIADEFCGEGHHHHHAHHHQSIDDHQIITNDHHEDQHEVNSGPVAGESELVHTGGGKSTVPSKRRRKSNIDGDHEHATAVLQVEPASKRGGRKSVARTTNPEQLSHLETEGEFPVGGPSTTSELIKTHEEKPLTDVQTDNSFNKEHIESHPSHSKGSVTLSEPSEKKLKGTHKTKHAGAGRRKSVKSKTGNHHREAGEHHHEIKDVIPAEGEQIREQETKRASLLQENSTVGPKVLGPVDTLESQEALVVIGEMEPNLQPHLDLKTETADGGETITYNPIISDDFDGCVRICKWVVGLHLEIERGVRETETDVTVPDTVTSVPAIFNPESVVAVPPPSKKTKSKGKSKKAIKDVGGPGNDNPPRSSSNV